MDAKIIALGRKLLALAERGIDGEKENAQRMLEAFMIKNDLSLSDIEPKTRTRRIVKGVNSDIRQMFINFVASVVGKDFKVNKCNGVGYWAVQMNDEEWNIFSERWDTYRKTLKKEIIKKRKQQRKELEILISAFISKHNMYPHDAKDETPASLTPEEYNDIMKMAEELEDIHFHKKLKKGN